MDRLKTNLEILKALENYFLQNPDLRFHQALCNLKINLNDTQYYEESLATLKRLNLEKKEVD